MVDKSTPVRTYVLDTNVLLHDPTCLFRFDEHDILIPMMVLEELDAKKSGHSELARNARQASRFLDEIIARTGRTGLDEGYLLENPTALDLGTRNGGGRLFFEAGDVGSNGSPDNHIIIATTRYRDRHPKRDVVLVSKDINMRIKATIIGLDAEDYANDQALDDLSLLYTGAEELAEDFWTQHAEVRSWNADGHTWYRLIPRENENWYPNQCLFIPGDHGMELRVMRQDEQAVELLLMDDHRTDKQSVWGIQARNPEQNFALNMLLDPEIDFVTLLGTAGTGKTLLSLAAGLAQVLDTKRYREIIMTRATIPVGEDIGFLPGTEEEKMAPWMGALSDNLEVLTQSEDGDAEHDDPQWGRAATNDLLAAKIKIRSPNFMRGRTFLNRYLIIDEAQNLTPKQMKTLITRAGPGTKIVCLGNIEQIDTPYLTETSSGLTYLVDRFKAWPYAAHVTLRRGERSRLADFAAKML